MFGKLLWSGGFGVCKGSLRIGGGGREGRLGRSEGMDGRDMSHVFF